MSNVKFYFNYLCIYSMYKQRDHSVMSQYWLSSVVRMIHHIIQHFDTLSSFLQRDSSRWSICFASTTRSEVRTSSFSFSRYFQCANCAPILSSVCFSRATYFSLSTRILSSSSIFSWIPASLNFDAISSFVFAYRST